MPFHSSHHIRAHPAPKDTGSRCQTLRRLPPRLSLVPFPLPPLPPLNSRALFPPPLRLPVQAAFTHFLRVFMPTFHQIPPLPPLNPRKSFPPTLSHPTRATHPTRVIALSIDKEHTGPV